MEKVINKVAVLGAGAMGSGIAGLLAGAGMQVFLLDVIPRDLTEEEYRAGLTEQSPVFRNRLAQAGYARIKNPKSGMLFSPKHIAYISVGNMTDDLHLLAECDWIIEVVVERLDAKRTLMRQVAAIRRPGTIVSTNTSGVSINAIAEGLPEEFRQHFLGTHFFNPARYMRLLELIPAADTLPEVVGRMAHLGESELGKSIVLAKDTPNFVGNRIGVFSYINCMQHMVKYGFNIPTVDLLTGPVLGRPASATFKTADMVGLDILCSVSRNVLDNTDNEREKAQYAVPGFVTDLAARGALGNKTGGGFYRKETVDGKKVPLAYDPDTASYRPLEPERFPLVEKALHSPDRYGIMAYGEGRESRFVWDTLKDTLLYAARLVPQITDDFRMIDTALRTGYNWEKGPFQIWDALGLERSVNRMRAEGEVIPDWIEKKLAAGETWFYTDDHADAPYLALEHQSIVAENDGARLRDLGDEVLCLEFRTRGNAIDLNVLQMMTESTTLLSAGNWRGLVIGGGGKNFSAGADLSLIGGYAQTGRWEMLEDAVAGLQRAMLSFKYAPRPIVAAPAGTALGGGAEVLMHAACTVPWAETYVGLVEAGVGLLPAGGGCTELLLRSVSRYAKASWSGMLPAVRNAWKLIATAAVTGSAQQAVENGYLDRSTRVVMNRDALLQAAKEAVLALDRRGYHPPVPAQVQILGDDGRAAILYDLELMKNGAFISAHDALIAKKIAYVLTGGHLPAGTQVTEAYLLGLEKEAFLSLAGEEKTQQRIAHMLATGKPLRN